jgi:hypothetical protein
MTSEDRSHEPISIEDERVLAVTMGNGFVANGVPEKRLWMAVLGRWVRDYVGDTLPINGVENPGAYKRERQRIQRNAIRQMRNDKQDWDEVCHICGIDPDDLRATITKNPDEVRERLLKQSETRMGDSKGWYGGGGNADN